MRVVPYRPAISDVLIKASANEAFRARLLSSPADVLGELNLPSEDMKLLTSIHASNLKEYATQVKIRLTATPF